MKPMWDIADHGGKHDDPVSGPPDDPGPLAGRGR